MSCQGRIGDYLCPGWRSRAAAIKERDGHRCRGCDRDEGVIVLEVHHRRYGNPGKCGECFLTSVAEEDLLTLCIECHEAITSVRRAARYANRVIAVGTVGQPPAVQEPIRVKAEVIVEPTTAPERTETVVRKTAIVPVEFIPQPDAAGVVIRPRQFNPFGKD